MRTTICLLVFLSVAAGIAASEEVSVKMNLVNAEGVGKEIGTITAMDTKHGLLLRPQLTDLPPGLHGFHLHEHPSCAPGKKDDKPAPAIAAGGHFDPQTSGKHEGPYGEGHLGDIPPLCVGADGKASLPVLAPRLKVSDLKGHSLMIHEGGDNYSDQPAALGGGGARIACGVIQ